MSKLTSTARDETEYGPIQEALDALFACETSFTVAAFLECYEKLYDLFSSDRRVEKYWRDDPDGLSITWRTASMRKAYNRHMGRLA